MGRYNLINFYYFKCYAVLVNRQDLTGIRYRDEILAPHVGPCPGAVGPDFLLMNDMFILTEDSWLMPSCKLKMFLYVCAARTPDLNTIQHLWDDLGRYLRLREMKLQANGEGYIMLSFMQCIPRLT